MALKEPRLFRGLRTKSKILVGIFIPLVMLAVLGTVSVYAISSIVATNKWVDHTNKVLGEAADLIGAAVDMETGMRGYLLAGKEEFLTPYRDGGRTADQTIAELRRTVADNPVQVERLDQARKILEQWRANVAEPTIGLRREIGDARTMNDMAAQIGQARGKKYFDKFRRQIHTFVERERILLMVRQGDAETRLKI